MPVNIFKRSQIIANFIVFIIYTLLKKHFSKNTFRKSVAKQHNNTFQKSVAKQHNNTFQKSVAKQHNTTLLKKV